MDLKFKISNSILKKIDQLSGEMKLERDEFILKALKKYIVITEMQRIRKRVKPKVKRLGYKSEEDIFRAVS